MFTDVESKLLDWVVSLAFVRPEACDVTLMIGWMFVRGAVISTGRITWGKGLIRSLNVK